MHSCTRTPPPHLGLYMYEGSIDQAKIDDISLLPPGHYTLFKTRNAETLKHVETPFFGKIKMNTVMVLSLLLVKYFVLGTYSALTG